MPMYGPLKVPFNKKPVYYGNKQVSNELGFFMTCAQTSIHPAFAS